MNPFSLFRQARTGAPLTPMQRAVLRFVEGLVAVAIVAALPVIAAALSSQSPNWSDVAREALAAAGVAVGLALMKWAKAQGDPLFSTVAAAIAQDVSAPQPAPQPAPVEPATPQQPLTAVRALVVMPPSPPTENTNPASAATTVVISPPPSASNS